MKQAFSILLCLLLATLSGHCYALSDSMSALKFMELKTDQPGTAKGAENVDGAWFIVEGGKDLAIRNIEDRDIRRSDIVFDSKTVKYIGVNHGEWGGGLYLDSVKKDAKPFIPGNITALLPIGKDLYVFEGLDHIMFTGAAIHAIRNYDTPSKPERVTLLPDVPYAVLNDGGRIIIAGAQTFMTFEPDNLLTVQHHEQFRSCIYTRIVKHHGHYVFGICGGVAAVPVDTNLQHEIRYFRPVAGK